VGCKKPETISDEMNIDTIITILGSNALTAIAGWFVGKRKVTAETDNQVLKNLELAISVYSQIINDLKKEIESLNIKVQELEGKIDRLHEENKMLK
jgi:peptidoglycan hydrolase CwlO-like protein